MLHEREILGVKFVWVEVFDPDLFAIEGPLLDHLLGCFRCIRGVKFDEGVQKSNSRARNLDTEHLV